MSSTTLCKVLQDSLQPPKDIIIELGLFPLAASTTQISPTDLIHAHELIKQELEQDAGAATSKQEEKKLIANWKEDCRNANLKLEEDAAKAKAEFDSVRQNLKNLFGSRLVDLDFNNMKSNTENSSVNSTTSPRQTIVECESALGSYARLISSNIQFRNFVHQAKRRQRTNTNTDGSEDINNSSVNNKFSILEQTLGLGYGTTAQLMLDNNRTRAVDSSNRREFVGAQVMRRDLKKSVLEGVLSVVEAETEAASKELERITRSCKY